MRPGARVFVRVPLFLAGCTLTLVLASALPVARGGPVEPIVIGALASLAGFALTTLFVRWDGVTLASVGAMPQRGSPGRLAMGFAIGLALVALDTALVGAFGHVRLVRTSGPGLPHVLLVLLGFLLLATREELAFHGYPLRRLQARIGPWPAQALIAAVFALEHVAGGWSVGQALWGAAVGSLLFGMASIATRGLAVPIGLHAAWNFADWARGNRPDPGLWRPEIAPGFGDAAASSGIACYVLVMLLATLGFWCWHRLGAAKAP